MLDKLEAILRDVCKLDKDKPILAGVSGGPDSLCLLAALHEAGWRVVAAHFNHMLRPEADEEAAAVEAIARKMGVTFVGGRGDVREHASKEKMSIETAARKLRYGFLFEQAGRNEAQAVAVGHTADDQVETVLMHFVRGTGLNGLKGMEYRSSLFDPDIPLVRPLLDLWRADTEAYCEAHGLQPHYDASNDSLDFLRNRLRHELIPMLETYNPRFREAAQRASRTVSSDYELLNAALEPARQKALVRRGERYVELDLEFLSRQAEGVQMRIVREGAETLIPELDLGYEALQRAAALIGDPSQERVDIAGGLFLLCEGHVLYLTDNENALPCDEWPQMAKGVDAMRLPIPGEAALASGWRVQASACDRQDAHLPESWETADPYQVWMDAQGLSNELKVRVRADGDRFEPLGLDGHSQKLSDFFVNVKLPARARARWPLVCAADEVIWVPGYRPAHAHRLRADSQQVLHIRLSRARHGD